MNIVAELNGTTCVVDEVGYIFERKTTSHEWKCDRCIFFLDKRGVCRKLNQIINGALVCRGSWSLDTSPDVEVL